jgi:hypothetical protein
MIVCTRGAPSLSLYMDRRLMYNSSFSQIQLRSSRSITESDFPNTPTRSVSNNLKSMPPWSVSFDIDNGPGLGPCIEVDLIQNPVDPVSTSPRAIHG